MDLGASMEWLNSNAPFLQVCVCSICRSGSVVAMAPYIQKVTMTRKGVDVLCWSGTTYEYKKYFLPTIATRARARSEGNGNEGEGRRNSVLNNVLS